jgi:hypothetical protein
LHALQHGVRNPGGPASALTRDRQARTVNPRGTTVMDGCRESDRFRVPRKPSHQGRPRGPAEQVEGRELAKGNVVGKAGAGHRAGASCHRRSPANGRSLRGPGR